MPDMATVQVRFRKPTDLLSAMHAYEVADEILLDSCDFETYTIPRHTEAQILQTMRDRGLGGNLNAQGRSDHYLIVGYEVARALATRYLGRDPASGRVGRGRIFRMCTEALTMAGH